MGRRASICACESPGGCHAGQQVDIRPTCLELIRIYCVCNPFYVKIGKPVPPYSSTSSLFYVGRPPFSSLPPIRRDASLSCSCIRIGPRPRADLGILKKLSAPVGPGPALPGLASWWQVGCSP